MEVLDYKALKKEYTKKRENDKKWMSRNYFWRKAIPTLLGKDKGAFEKNKQEFWEYLMEEFLKEREEVQ